MIIWLNGAFGAGKTQTAYTLQRRMRGAYVYDPENAGYFIRQNIPPPVHEADFQDYPMWRAFNLEMLRYIARRYAGDIIVPMTITNKMYYDEMIGVLSKEFDVKHFILSIRGKGNAFEAAGVKAGGPPLLGGPPDRPVRQSV